MIRRERHVRFPGWPRALLFLALLGGAWFALSRAVPWLAEVDQARIDAERAAMAAATEAAEIAFLRDFEQAFAQADLNRQLAFCRERIRAALPYWRPLHALALTPVSVDAYVPLSLRSDSLHRLSCRADGLHESRVVHPLGEALLAARVEAAPTTGADLPDLWRQGEALIDRSLAEGAPQRLELLLLADHRTVAVRRRIAQPDGELRDLVPAGATVFASLVAADAPPEGLASRMRTRWSSEAGAAFDLLAGMLPADAAIVGARFDDDALSVTLRGPRRGLDAPFGAIELDAWGEPTSWLYPYDVAPGFACEAGINLTALRERFDAACARLAGCAADAHFSIADYACATGRESGDWLLHLQSR